MGTCIYRSIPCNCDRDPWNPVLPFAIGVYLPVQLNACIMVGGLVRLGVEKYSAKKANKDAIVNDGVLFCSGMIKRERVL